MKSHRRKAALLSALLMAIGLAALPLEGAAFKIKDPLPPTQPGDPDGPTSGNSVKWFILWVRPLQPALILFRTSKTDAPSQTSVRTGTTARSTRQ